MQFRDLVNVLDGEQLLQMHEYMPMVECSNCLGTGFKVAMAFLGGEPLGIVVDMTQECENCVSGYTYLGCLS